MEQGWGSQQEPQVVFVKICSKVEVLYEDLFKVLVEKQFYVLWNIPLELLRDESCLMDVYKIMNITTNNIDICPKNAFLRRDISKRALRQVVVLILISFLNHWQ